MKKIDLKGKRFGSVVVIGECGRANDGHVAWICKCDCGNEIIARSNNLINGHTKSCGMHHEVISKNKKKELKAKIIPKQNGHFIYGNEYDVYGKSVYVKLRNCNESFVCDLSDIDVVKEYTWHKNDKGYVATRNKIKFHQIIMPCSKEEMVDHINGNKLDNRRNNLRIVTKYENCQNSKRKTTESGKTGVIRTKNGRWKASITCYRITYQLGVFEDLEEAIKVRKEAEMKYFGMYCRS